MTVMVFAAHSDDEVLGVGGVLAKLKCRKIVITFSYGGRFPPWIKREKLIKRRVTESKKADEILGIERTIYLGLEDLKVTESLEKGAVSIVKKLIKKYKPTKVFYHSINDTHPDHIAVNYIVNKALNELKSKAERHTFEISNFFNLFERNKVKIVYDISDTFQTKIKALKQFKSQKILLKSLIFLLTLKSIREARKFGFKYAEVFYLK